MIRRPNKYSYLSGFSREVSVDAPRRPLGRRFLSWLLILLNGAFVWWLVWSPFWRIAHVTVEGTTTLSGDQLATETHLIGRNIFSVRVADVDTILARHPELATFEVVRLLPRTVKIVVTQKKPVLQWITGGQAYAVDDSGVAFMTLPADDKDLPHVTDTANVAIALNQVVVPKSFITTFNEVEQRLPIIYTIPVQGYEVGETVYDLDAILADGRRVKFNILSNATQQLAELERLNRLRPDLVKRSILDLRVDRWAYIQ